MTDCDFDEINILRPQWVIE